MNIALCLSGHARTYALTHKFWEAHVLSKHNVDVFMHLWDTVGPRSFGESRSERSPLPREDFDSGIVESPEVNLSHVSKIWNPVAIAVEPYQAMHKKFERLVKPILDERDRRGIPAGFEHHHPLSVRSMLYKRFKCNNLKKVHEDQMGRKYDLVIQTRPDVAITSEIIDKAWNEQNKLYFHNCRSVTPDPEINDFGAFGSSENINKWCDLYLHVDSLFEKIKYQENFFKFLNPHKMYVQYLLEINQPYEELDIGLSIVRDTGIILGWPYAQKIIQGALS